MNGRMNKNIYIKLYKKPQHFRGHAPKRGCDTITLIFRQNVKNTQHALKNLFLLKQCVCIVNRLHTGSKEILMIKEK